MSYKFKDINELVTSYKNKPKNGLLVTLRYNSNLNNELIKYTEFLNSYSDVTISERLYYFIHNIKYVQLCPYCNQKRRKLKKLDKGLYHTCGNIQCKKQGMSLGAKQARNWNIITNKARQTYLNAHGVLHNMQDPIFIKNQYIKHIETKYHYKVINYNSDNNTVILQCTICNSILESFNKNYIVKKLYHNIGLCPKCDSYKEGRSSFEDDILTYIKSIYKKEILTNKRLFKNYEYDIILSDINLIIECNGIYWHNHNKKAIDYHYNKLIEAHKHNYKLLYIWENEWHTTNSYIQDIIYNTIYNHYNKLSNIQLFKSKYLINIYNNNILIYKGVYFNYHNNISIYDITFDKRYNYNEIIQQLKIYFNKHINIYCKTDNILLYNYINNVNIIKQYYTDYFYCYMNKQSYIKLNTQQLKVYTSGISYIQI